MGPTSHLGIVDSAHSPARNRTSHLGGASFPLEYREQRRGVEHDFRSFTAVLAVADDKGVNRTIRVTAV
jgi:hypothetical protein